MSEGKECRCGSGKPRWILYDARSIPCGYVCDDCEAKTKAKYRPDIFTDSQYWSDEPIDEDE
jgi:hypothetical protein